MTDPEGRSGRQGGVQSELLQRLVSAVLLAIAAVAVTYAGLWPFVAAVALAAVIGCWEWARLVRGRTLDPALVLHGASVVGAGVAAATGHLALAFAVLAAGTILVGLLARRAGALWSAVGVLYLGLPFLAVAVLRADPDFGIAAIYYLFLVAWGTDAAAYAAGRTLGGPKLAPAISPNKTWSGFLGGIAVPVAVAAGLAYWSGETSTSMIAALTLSLAVLVHLGDLAESALKRRFGAKDTSALIPGHGGVLDRVDGFIFASIAAGGLALARDSTHPGQALLIWS